MRNYFYLSITEFMLFCLFQTILSKKTFYHWQCSLPSRNTIYSLVEQNFEAFRVIGWPEWMSKDVNYQYIDCAQRGLHYIPQGLDRSVEILNLKVNSITHIRKPDFDSYSSLVALSLIDNCIVSNFYDSALRRCTSPLTVESGALSHLLKLKYLALSSTMMKQLPEMLPRNIKVLMASYANLGPIKQKDVEYLASLELVSFSTNCIMADPKHFCTRNFTISEPIFSSSNLKFLDLAYNNFTFVPSYLFQQSLLGIKLRGNPLNWVRSNDFINATNITYLNLAWTSQYIRTPLQIENGSFQELKNLEILDLSANMISNLPEHIFLENSKLKALNLELNCLKMIETDPIILPSLPFLEQLSLAGNTYCTDSYKPVKRTVPKLKFGNSYQKFPNLTTLSLGILQQFSNTDFDASFLYMYLSYGSNYDRIDGDSLSVLKNLSHLRNLGLAACGIRLVNTSAFKGLNFNRLDLQINQIGEESKKSTKEFRFKRQVLSQRGTETLNNVNHWSFTKPNQYDIYYRLHKQGGVRQEHRKNTAVASISRNAISSLQTFSLKDLNFVTHLDLSSNHINYIRESDFQYLSMLRVLDLRYNPIRHIHHKALNPLVQLTDLRVNLTEYQEQFSIDFLHEAQQNLTLKFGDTSWFIYRLFQYYNALNVSVCFYSVTEIDLSYIRIPSFFLSRNQPVFKPLCNLTNLKINGAQITFHPQSNFFEGVTQLQRLSMRECWLQRFPYLALKSLHYLTHLDLSHNQIEVLSERLMFSFPNLKSLLLSHNFIYEIFPGTLHKFSSNGLNKIDLSFNQIKYINKSIVDSFVLKAMDYIDLRGNEVHCDCSLSDTFGWLIRSGKLNNSKIPGFLPDCSNALVNYYGGCIACDRSTSEKPLSLFTYTITNNCQEFFLLRLATLFNSFIVLFLIIALLCKAMKKRLLSFLLNNVLVQGFSKQINQDQTSSSVYVYHGFVYYDKENVEVGNWVDQVLLPKLENGNSTFKIAVLGREDWCGTTQVQQLLLKMRASKKTIVILSGNFFSTSKCQYVLSVLEEWIYAENVEKCVVIIFGDCKSLTQTFMQKYPRSSCLMLYYSPIEEQPLFWDVLTNVMTLQSC